MFCFSCFWFLALFNTGEIEYKKLFQFYCICVLVYDVFSRTFHGLLRRIWALRAWLECSVYGMFIGIYIIRMTCLFVRCDIEVLCCD